MNCFSFFNFCHHESDDDNTNNNTDFKSVQKKSNKNILKTLLVTIPISIVYEILCSSMIYLTIPSWNFKYAGSWIAIIFLIAPIAFIIGTLIKKSKDEKECDYFYSDSSDSYFIGFASFVIFIFITSIIILIANSFTSPMYKANKYYQEASSHITVVEETKSDNVFPELIKNEDTSNVPIYQQQEALKKCKAELAKETSLGSQVDIDEYDFISQSINGSLVYTNTTKPKSVFKRNADQQYYTVDRNNGETTSYDASDFKYMPNLYFDSNAVRYLRSNNKGSYVTDCTLEISNDGTPYYVASILSRDFYSGYDKVTGVIVLDPVTGKTTIYDVNNVPSWVDRVYPEEILLQYIEMYGKYSEGFWNTVFKKENVLEPTTVKKYNDKDIGYVKEYEIVYVNGEPFLWTGMNAASSDTASDSNGIIMASLKTGEITYYKTSGVSENHAVEIAEGLVQEKGYTASYPIPLEINKIPSMFMVMRDKDDNTVGYSMVSYKDYTKSAYSESLNGLVTSYLSALGKTNETETMSNAEIKTVKGTIEDIASEVVDSRTMYYIIIDGKTYSLTSKLNVQIAFAKVGDNITLTYAETETPVIPVKSIIFQ